MSEKLDTPITTFNPYAGQHNNLGEAYRGFIEEVDISLDGEPIKELEIYPLIKQFFAYYPGRLPKFTEWINSWHHFIGPPALYFMPNDQGAVIEGFRSDFLRFYTPPSMGHHDLSIHNKNGQLINLDKIFMDALFYFIENYRFPQHITPENFFPCWHDFLKVDAVIYQQSALCSDYQKLNMPSYQEAYWELFPGKNIMERFQNRLTKFYYNCLEEEEYFLPSHFYDQWIDQIEKEG